MEHASPHPAAMPLTVAVGDFLARHIAYLALVLVVLIFAMLAPERFLTLDNLGTVLQNSTVLALVAIGLTFVIIGGSIDLSVGSVMALAGVCAAWAIPHLGMWAFVAAMLAGAVIGAINGGLFVWGRIPSFVVTLGMLSVVRGAVVILTDGTPVPVGLTSPYNHLGDPPMPLMVMAAFAVLMALLLKFTTFGRYVYAIGGDEEKTRMLGVPVRGVQFAMFVMAGLMAGTGGAIVAAQIGSGSPTTGRGFELMAISAVVIGGTPLTGGLGSIVGTVVGALVMTTLANGLIILGVSTNVQTVLTGVVLMTAVLVSIRRGKLRTIK